MYYEFLNKNSALITEELVNISTTIEENRKYYPKQFMLRHQKFYTQN